MIDSLFDIAPPNSKDPAWLLSPQTDLEKAFKAFHEANPHVYTRLEERAIRDAGSNRLSISKLAEQLRADIGTSTVGDAFKINNSYRALYARLLIHRNPVLDGKFELRVRRDRAAEAAHA